MKRLCFLIVTSVFWLFLVQPVKAVTNPLKAANNRVGVHILDPNEVDKVANLVNSNGGDWGYVTVPLRADDRNRAKWQQFFDSAKENHLIPIIRLATVMTSDGWAKPTLYEAVDFANFLNDLDWPTQNRYVIVYNEPNHATEWGGEVNPQDYARILKYTAQIFKDRNENFYILPAGLDAAAPSDQSHLSLRQFVYQMENAYPGIFKVIDGLSSHSYPNPAFSGKPTDSHQQSIVSFRQELNLIEPLAAKKLPVFITETGWSNQALSDETIAAYYQTAFSQIWQDSQVVAVTPFVIYAGDGPFMKFSLLYPDGSHKPQYQAIEKLSKEAGRPEVNLELVAQVLGEEAANTQKQTFAEQSPEPHTSSWGKENWKKVFKWFRGQ